jgi:putative ubiquitin-RnfH superfamily antitoxin RatB of RatAB toxin-antitoxin module
MVLKITENATMITVEVAYALPDRQVLYKILVSKGTTAMEAIRQSGVVAKFPEIDLATSKVGIFSQVLGAKGLASADVYELKASDRVEIYRSLLLDPKEIRRRRAEQAKSKSVSINITG